MSAIFQQRKGIMEIDTSPEALRALAKVWDIDSITGTTELCATLRALAAENPEAEQWPQHATEPMQMAMQRAVLLRKSMNDVWRAALAEAGMLGGWMPLPAMEAEQWRPIETMPNSGEFLLLVSDGEWRNPDLCRVVYHAHGYPGGPTWSKKGQYRTEEGGAYKLLGWMPLPEGTKP